jgi:hypothetical protein
MLVVLLPSSAAHYHFQRKSVQLHLWKRQLFGFAARSPVSPPKSVLSELAARSEFQPASVSLYWFGDPTLPLDRLPRLCGFSLAGVAGRD